MTTRSERPRQAHGALAGAKPRFRRSLRGAVAYVEEVDVYAASKRRTS